MIKTVLLGFGVVYLIGAVLLAFDITHIPTLKDVSVLAFLLPGVVALVAHLEIAKLKKQAARHSQETGRESKSGSE